MLSPIYVRYHKIGPYTEGHYAERHYADCRGASETAAKLTKLAFFVVDALAK